MGNVHRTHAIDIHITGDKEGVRLGDHGLGRIIQFIEALGRTCRRILQGHRLILPQLDVLRAVAIGLIHCHGKSARGHRADMPIDAIAPAGMQLNAQQTDRRTRAQLRRIIARRQAAELQQSRFR
ncbi:hypothetical protein D3C81_1891440 [compost metagenome]